MPQQRIQKILAAGGFGSRRACEKLVTDGHVEIDGETVSDLPIVVDPAKCRITVEGKPVRLERYVYFLLNKPKGYFCTNSDPDGRRRAIDLMVGVRERLFPVGRLDAETTGLLIMTNDGELAQKLTHPKFQTPKTYRAEVRGQPQTEALEKLRKGVWLAEGRTGPAEVSVIHSSRQKAVLEITLREGRNREIRRMLARFGHPVNRLTRIKMGRISIKRLPLGSYRPLTEAEVKYLHRLAEGLASEEPAPTVRIRKKVVRKRAGARRPRDHGMRSNTVKKRAAERGGKKKVRGAPPSRGKATTRKAPMKKRPGKKTERETALPPRSKKKRRIISVD